MENFVQNEISSVDEPYNYILVKILINMKYIMSTNASRTIHPSTYILEEQELSPNVKISRPFPFYFPSLQIVNDSLRCAKLNCANNLDNKLNSSRRQEHISLHYQDLGNIIKQMLQDAL